MMSASPTKPLQTTISNSPQQQSTVTNSLQQDRSNQWIYIVIGIVVAVILIAVGLVLLCVYFKRKKEQRTKKIFSLRNSAGQCQQAPVHVVTAGERVSLQSPRIDKVIPESEEVYGLGYGGNDYISMWEASSSAVGKNHDYPSTDYFSGQLEAKIGDRLSMRTRSEASSSSCNVANPAEKRMIYSIDVSDSNTDLHLEDKPKVWSLPVNNYESKPKPQPRCSRTLPGNSLGKYDNQYNKSLDDMRSVMMKSQDSGFCSNSNLSLDNWHESPSHLHNYDLLLQKCPTEHKAGLRRFLTGIHSNGDQFSAGVITVGAFDHKGGTMVMASDNQIKLHVPHGALTSLQILYIIVECESTEFCTTASYSPVFECGPDGLQFKKAVELTFPHAAENVDVVAVSRQEGAKQWNEDDDAAVVTEINQNLATFKINHFTGFKLSRRMTSRIPIRKNERQNNGMAAKNLCMNLFCSPKKAKLYILVGKNISMQQVVESKEAFDNLYPVENYWKEFRYVKGNGNLEFKVTDDNNYEIKKWDSFSESKVESLQMDSLTFNRKNRDVLEINVKVFQSADEGCYSLFSVLFDSLPSQNIDREALQFPHSARVQSSSFNYATSISQLETVTEESTIQRKQGPQESCSCQGACNCEVPENQYESYGSQVLLRADPNRKSKESGYESSTTFSPKPLHGPESICDLTTKSDSSCSLNFTFDQQI